MYPKKDKKRKKLLHTVKKKFYKYLKKVGII